MIEITRKEADYIYSNVVVHLEGGSKKKEVYCSIINNFYVKRKNVYTFIKDVKKDISKIEKCSGE